MISFQISFGGSTRVVICSCSEEAILIADPGPDEGLSMLYAADGIWELVFDETMKSRCWRNKRKMKRRAYGFERQRVSRSRRRAKSGGSCVVALRVTVSHKQQ